MVGLPTSPCSNNRICQIGFNSLKIKSSTVDLLRTLFLGEVILALYSVVASYKTANFGLVMQHVVVYSLLWHLFELEK